MVISAVRVWQRPAYNRTSFAPLDALPFGSENSTPRPQLSVPP